MTKEVSISYLQALTIILMPQISGSRRRWHEQSRRKTKRESARVDFARWLISREFAPAATHKSVTKSL